MNPKRYVIVREAFVAEWGGSPVRVDFDLMTTEDYGERAKQHQLTAMEAWPASTSILTPLAFIEEPDLAAFVRMCIRVRRDHPAPFPGETKP